MHKGLRTEVDLKFLRERVKVVKELSVGSRYVYQVSHGKNLYIVKGYEIVLEHLKAGNEESCERFTEALTTISDIYQEYYFSKIASVFSQHFAKALEMDMNLKLAPNDYSMTYLYIEIMFEHGGDSLNHLGNFDVTSLYNLMRQSASALSLLHSTGITHLDIKPANMVYNKSADLLKIIDMGGSFGYGISNKLYSPTIDMGGKIKELTREFSPPEVLKLERGQMPGNQMIIGTVDVYCWAMTFYSILLSKTPAQLQHEANYYKLSTEKEYNNFLKSVGSELEELAIKDADKKKRDFIVGELFRGLCFKPEKRSKMPEVVERMKEFEKLEGLKLNYFKVDKEYKKKLAKILMLDPSDDIDYGKSVTEAKSALKVLMSEINRSKEEYKEYSKRLKRNRDEAKSVGTSPQTP
eukprot:TRINITY_DN16261_c0_g1_i7.p1 TRINITY_DN16261_c0_g1~~TRINITY_DN16261_c0_g1_i7.p1  ORF type:complete len:409 (-),score=118.02 TRINITY_DN16261_c0_g1_i7:100-1326(-)